MGEALHRRPAQQISLQGNYHLSDPSLASFYDSDFAKLIDYHGSDCVS